ncbi:MAG: GNAT family N-acetyltransferase [Acidimicrobiia bacterium]
MIETNLPDGTSILVRPVRPEDKPLLAAGMERLSERSRRLRFLTATDRLSRSQLAYLTEVDGRDHQAWGVLSDDEPVAVGRFIRGSGDEAEVALTVVDEWQRRGIGLLLLEVLAAEAEKVGILRFTFVALPENTGIRALLARFGVTGEIEDGLLTAHLDVAAVHSVLRAK